MSTTLTPPRPSTKVEPATGRFAALLASPATALAVIWLCSALTAIYAPDMISGSQQEHLPLAAITIWLWTLSATAYVLLGSRQQGSGTLTAGTSVVWMAVTLVSLAAPVMETGTDPTQIPIAALLAPVVGALATGFIAVQQASRPTT